MRIYYLGKNEDFTRAVIIEASKKEEEKKLDYIIMKLEEIGYKASGFDGDNGLYYMLPVDDKKDYEDLKSEYKSFKKERMDK